MGIFQARILEWVALPSSEGSSQPRNWTEVSSIAGRFFTIWATREAQTWCEHDALAGNWTRISLVEGKNSTAEPPVQTRFKPSQNPAWDLNPPGWDSNPAKTHGTWFQDLMKLRFLMSYHRKNSVRDKVVGKKWIYSDSERSTFHRQSVGHPRGQVGLRNVTWFVLMGWVQFIWPLHLLMGARAP